VGNAGSPYPRFQRALKTGKLHIIKPLAIECPRIELVDAAVMLALYPQQDPRGFEPAAARWMELFTGRRPRPAMEQIGQALDALELMRTHPQDALGQLRALCA
jgi:hypothetical protein